MPYMVMFFKQETAYEMRISDWSSDVCSSDLRLAARAQASQLIGQGLAIDDRAAVADRGEAGVHGPEIGKSRGRVIRRIAAGQGPVMIAAYAGGGRSGTGPGGILGAPPPRPAHPARHIRADGCLRPPHPPEFLS